MRQKMKKTSLKHRSCAVDYCILVEAVLQYFLGLAMNRLCSRQAMKRESTAEIAIEQASSFCAPSKVDFTGLTYSSRPL